MAVLSKFEITYKDASSSDVSFVFQYNPSSLSISKSVEWRGFSVSGEDKQKKQFASGNAKTLTLSSVLFDTSMLGEKNVFTNFIAHLEQMTLVQEYEGDGIRPPILTISWGDGNYFFESVLTKLDYDFTMFSKKGTPIRANVNLTFEEIETESTKKNTVSAQSTKTYIVKSNDTLQGIAKSQLGSEAKWKIIAVANGIDNPMELSTGTSLTIPTLS